VGTDATEADNACLRQEQLLASGEGGVVQLTERDDNRDLRAAVKKYLADIEDHKKGKTHAAYSTALEYFLETCRQASLDDITRDDILAFTKYLRSQGLSDRSVYNNFLNVRTFLKAHGVTCEMMGLQKSDTPKYTKKKPNIYDPEELDGFFKGCSDEERVIFKFFLNRRNPRPDRTQNPGHHPCEISRASPRKTGA
jgi:integrase